MFTREQVQEIERAAVEAARAALAKLGRSAPSVQRIGISDDVLQKARVVHALDEMDIAARLTAHVKQALGQPQPMDVTSGGPAALAKGASTAAEDMLRRDADQLRRAAAARLCPDEVTPLAEERERAADLVAAVKKAHAAPQVASLAVFAGGSAVPRPDRTAEIQADLDAARAAGLYWRAEQLQHALAVETIRVALNRPLPWIRPADAAPSDHGVPASAGAITPKRAGTQLLGDTPE